MLILREVLEYSAAEVAQILDTTPAAVNSALQRARKAVKEGGACGHPAGRTGRTRRGRPAGAGRRLRGRLGTGRVNTILTLLADDARFTMPPLPAWFDGREDVGRFLAMHVFASAWRLVPIRANRQPAFACYQQDPNDHRFRLGAINVLGFRDGQIAEIAGFLDPDVHRRFGYDADRKPCEGAWVTELTGLLALTGTPARVWEPKRLRLRLFQIVGRIARRSRRLWLDLSAHAPFGHLVATAMTRLKALPQLA